VKSTQLAHSLISDKLFGGEVVIDATAGNGHDAFFLANLVGVSGTIYAFDVQKDAINNTRLKLQQMGYSERLRLINSGHEKMRESIPAEHHGRIAVIMFNLGYLPGGDHSITTLKETTLEAISQGLELLAPEGIMTIVCYPGHQEGKTESILVDDYVKKMDSNKFEFCKYINEKASEDAPFLIKIKKHNLL